MQKNKHQLWQKNDPRVGPHFAGSKKEGKAIKAYNANYAVNEARVVAVRETHEKFEIKRLGPIPEPVKQIESQKRPQNELGEAEHVMRRSDLHSFDGQDSRRQSPTELGRSDVHVLEH